MNNNRSSPGHSAGVSLYLPKSIDPTLLVLDHLPREAAVSHSSSELRTQDNEYDQDETKQSQENIEEMWDEYLDRSVSQQVEGEQAEGEEHLDKVAEHIESEQQAEEQGAQGQQNEHAGTGSKTPYQIAPSPQFIRPDSSLQKSIFDSYEGAKKHLSLPYWRPRFPDETIPPEKADLKEMKCVIVDALYNTKDCIDEGTKCWDMFERVGFPPIDVEAIAWHILNTLIRLHKFGSSVWDYTTHPKATLPGQTAQSYWDSLRSVNANQDLNFQERFNAVVHLLTLSKAAACGAMWRLNIDSIVDAPVKSFREVLEDVPPKDRLLDTPGPSTTIAKGKKRAAEDDIEEYEEEILLRAKRTKFNMPSDSTFGGLARGKGINNRPAGLMAKPVARRSKLFQSLRNAAPKGRPKSFVRGHGPRKEDSDDDELAAEAPEPRNVRPKRRSNISSYAEPKDEVEDEEVEDSDDEEDSSDVKSDAEEGEEKDKFRRQRAHELMEADDDDSDEYQE